MLSAQHRRSARHAMLREERAVLAEFHVRCKAVGISTHEAMRQLVRAHLSDPKAYPQLSKAKLDGRLSGGVDDPKTVAAFKAEAVRLGLTRSELMRCLIRHYLQSCTLPAEEE